MNPSSSPSMCSRGNLPCPHLSSLTLLSLTSQQPPQQTHPIHAQILLVLHWKHLQNLTTSTTATQAKATIISCQTTTIISFLVSLFDLACFSLVSLHWQEQSCWIMLFLHPTCLSEQKSRLSSGPWSLWDLPPCWSSGLDTHPQPLTSDMLASSLFQEPTWAPGPSCT